MQLTDLFCKLAHEGCECTDTRGLVELERRRMLKKGRGCGEGAAEGWKPN